MRKWHRTLGCDDVECRHHTDIAPGLDLVGAGDVATTDSDKDPLRCALGRDRNKTINKFGRKRRKFRTFRHFYDFNSTFNLAKPSLRTATRFKIVASVCSRFKLTQLVVIILFFIGGCDAQQVASTGSQTKQPDINIFAVRVNEPETVIGKRDGILCVKAGEEVRLALFGRLNTQIDAVKVVETDQNCQNTSDGTVYPASKLNRNNDNIMELSVTLPENDKLYQFCVKRKIGNYEPQTARNDAKLCTMVKKKQTYFPPPLQIFFLALLLCLSGLFSGLNLGLMALNPTDLELIIKSGSKSEQRYAATILPVRKTGNYLLCSLLLGNVVVNAGITILFDDLTSGWIALVVSSLGIVVFGEIVPQSVCNRKGLAVGAHTIYITRLFMYATAPLSWPISKILDCILGEEAGTVYDRDKLRELIKISAQAGPGNVLDEFTIVTGALEYTRKVVKDVYTPVEHVFMLSADTKLDHDRIYEITATGYTRIPVFEDNDRNRVVSLLNVKDLALLDPDDGLSVKTVCSYYDHQVRFVMEDTPLKVMLDEFRKGQYHLAMVQRIEEPKDGSDSYFVITGIVTLEDIIEEIIQAEINDETDVYTDNVNRKQRRTGKRRTGALMGAEQAMHAQVSRQLLLAATQWLSSNEPAFAPQNISQPVLERLVGSTAKYERAPTELLTGLPTKYLYNRGCESNKYILILEGRATVKIGQANHEFEAGPFHKFGDQVLNKVLDLAPDIVHATHTRAIGSAQQQRPISPLVNETSARGSSPQLLKGTPHRPRAILNQSQAGRRFSMFTGSISSKSPVTALSNTRPGLQPQAHSPGGMQTPEQLRNASIGGVSIDKNWERLTTFTPDYDALVTHELTYLEIDPKAYMGAYRMSIIERSKSTLGGSRSPGDGRFSLPHIFPGDEAPGGNIPVEVNSSSTGRPQTPSQPSSGTLEVKPRTSSFNVDEKAQEAKDVTDAKLTARNSNVRRTIGSTPQDSTVDLPVQVNNVGAAPTTTTDKKSPAAAPVKQTSSNTSDMSNTSVDSTKRLTTTSQSSHTMETNVDVEAGDDATDPVV